MKKLLSLISLPIMLVHADPIMIEKVSHTLAQIQYESNQKPTNKIDIKYDPFYHDKKIIATKIRKQQHPIVQQSEKKSLVLSMILNKKAFINGVWYKENQKVAQYMLSKVYQDSVVLKQNKTTIVLKLKLSNNLFVKKEVL